MIAARLWRFECDLELGDLKRQLQEHFKDGLCLIVGSGLSCAEELPSMSELANKLDEALPSRLDEEDQEYWTFVSNDVRERGLEAALLKNPPPLTVEQQIVSICAAYIERSEAKVVQEVFSARRVLPLTRLFQSILIPNTGLPVVTTNYDRLIEIAAEEASLGVDDLFIGRFAGRLDEQSSKWSFCKGYTEHRKRIQFLYRSRIALFKPHGSLGWYHRDGQPVSYAGALPFQRLIITPGLNKYQTGYESPFDKHREKANAAIDGSLRLAIFGYGFNDAHLETHLLPKIRRGTPTLVLTMRLSDQARALARQYGNILALESFEDNTGTTAYINGVAHSFNGTLIWSLPVFLREVLRS